MSPTVSQQFSNFEKPPTFSHDSLTIRKFLTVESTRLVVSPLQFAYSSPTVLTLGQKKIKREILTDDQMLGIRFLLGFAAAQSVAIVERLHRVGRLCSVCCGRSFGLISFFAVFRPLWHCCGLGLGVARVWCVSCCMERF